MNHFQFLTLPCLRQYCFLKRKLFKLKAQENVSIRFQEFWTEYINNLKRTVMITLKIFNDYFKNCINNQTPLLKSIKVGYKKNKRHSID